MCCPYKKTKDTENGHQKVYSFSYLLDKYFDTPVYKWHGFLYTVFMDKK